MVQAPDTDMLESTLPQALTLLSEMRTSAQHVASLVDRMLERVRNGELSTDQGLSFLEVKYNTLLGYLINLTHFILRKCSGQGSDGDPCIARLVEIRAVLEKVRPIDQKLKYQIDKLVKTACSGAAATTDPASYGPRPDELADGSDDEEETEPEKKTGVYVPPKLSAVHYSGDETAQERNRRQQERGKKRALSSALMEELREEYLDTPTEVAGGGVAQRAASKRERERQEYEEEYMTRLPVSKEEKRTRKKLTTVGSLGDEITDFGSGGPKRKRSAGKFKGKAVKRRRKH